MYILLDRLSDQMQVYLTNIHANVNTATGLTSTTNASIPLEREVRKVSKKLKNEMVEPVQEFIRLYIYIYIRKHV